jgi:argininosuccinate lyase
MNVEKRLTEIIGDAGARLHTARSRNDQVATDLRLYARAQALELRTAVWQLRQTFVDQAKQHVDTLAPAYTHLQRAQPILLAHHMLAYEEMLSRDHARLSDAIMRLNVSPLGSGALAGTPHAIDRVQTAFALGFADITRNSLDAVSDRDFAVELGAACALLLVHLSRFGEELVLWSSFEFQFVKLPEGYCSGSSMMPQKVNPDIPELLRAKSGRVVGDLVTLLMVLKGLPLAYNKDLQETQEPLYDILESSLLVVQTLIGLVQGLRFNTERLARAVDEGHLNATELADYLVKKGVPFRAAHSATGAIVRAAASRNVELAGLSIADMIAAAPGSPIANDVYAFIDARASVERRNLVGGPAKAQIESAIAATEARLASEQ